MGYHSPSCKLWENVRIRNGTKNVACPTAFCTCAEEAAQIVFKLDVHCYLIMVSASNEMNLTQTAIVAVYLV